ncbi:hypothetical protein WA026_003790 [Henosepilachna vigintioctopunctata]|uniref:Carboxylic ester hydrolase n=1 Tax=Henosepilachna vigintioctopunctata TaxID=420089 RepID=A0AAW1UGT7_9CUCU
MMLVLFFVIGVSSALGSNADPVVQISSGKIRGKILENFYGNSFYAFQGIPYAKAPVGELRYQPPQRPDNWEGILDDRNANTICIQLTSTQLPNESEDCLFLHVYTPQLPSKDNNVSLPVVYVVHGGAFVEGSALIDSFGPDLMMDYGVIMVVVQYRLGFFGFLSTGDLACPGNNGLKDQQFGLRWVQENIRHFGGDPTRVTLFGQSAGAASVSYQTLAKNSEGLFRSVIQNSGSALVTWSLQRYPREIAYRIANQINSNVNESYTTTDLMNFYKTVEVCQVKKACVDIFGEGLVASFFLTGLGYLLAGVIEPEHDGAFLTETAYNKYESGRFNAVPTLMGMNSEESIFIILDNNFQNELQDRDENPSLLTSTDMHITDEAISNKVGSDIKRMYVGDGKLCGNLGPSIRMFSEIGFGKPLLKQVQLHSKFSDVYLYEFAYSGSLGREAYPFAYIPGAEKVTHGEEMLYIFVTKATKDLSKYPEKDIITLRRTLTMWTNFVKFMNPTPEPSELLGNKVWPKVTSTDKIPYLYIDETLDIKYNLKQSMVDEYHRLYSTYAVPPLDTY